MAWKGKLKHGLKLRRDQENVMEAFFDNKPGRVCVSASAGTGKTTLLVEIFCETVVRRLGIDPDGNPFEDILAVTFNVEAARKMKSKIRERLEKHFESPLGSNMLMNLENRSWILTLDAFTRRLLSEIALDANISPNPAVPDDYDLAAIEEGVLDEIERDPAFAEHIRKLAVAFPVHDWRGKLGWKSAIPESLRKARMYCLSADDLEKNAKRTFRKEIYKGRNPPFSRADAKKIVSNIRDVTSIDNSHLEASYYLNLDLLKSFFAVLSEYEKRYDRETRDKGLLGHDDARYWITSYSNKPLDGTENQEVWKETQRKRFKSVLVDEFQDTSYVQCSLLKNFIGEETRVLVIGDPKQAIYQWRNADPEIFIEILSDLPQSPRTSSSKIKYLEAEGFCKLTLNSNFRSHEDLIVAFNELFGKNGSVFSNPINKLNYPVPHPDLVAEIQLPPGEEPIQKHLHPIVTHEPEEIARVLRGIEDGTLRLSISRNGKWRDATLGDCAILIRSRNRYWRRLRNVFIEEGIKYFLLAEKGFFGRPEVSLLIDILDWLGNPYNKDSLIRILRSPIVGLGDDVLRYLASHNFYVEIALSDPNPPPLFGKEAREMLRGLINLRDDLRWTREGKKSSLLGTILAYSHLDTTILTLPEGKQCLSNLWYLQDIIASWEQEELLSYEELLDRLRWYRESGTDAYNMAALADEEDTSSVKLATIHATKGLQFPVVFLFYPFIDLRRQYIGMPPLPDIYTRDQGRFFSLRQLSPDGFNANDWEKYLRPDGSLDSALERYARNERCLFDEFSYDFFAETWRLYYVAMTRAEYHLFHNIQEPYVKVDDPSSRYLERCWQHEFYSWSQDSDAAKRLIGDPDIGEQRPTPSPKEIAFSKKVHGTMSKRLNGFFLASLNPSHIYDLIYCPRKYQYAVLQQVGSGPHCNYQPGATHDKVRFGTDVHKALELIDFRANNKPYEDYLAFLQKNDAARAKRVERAVEEFKKSQIFTSLGLSENRTLKEYEVVHSTTTKPGILLISKTDLTVDTDEGLHIVDYKTNYPKGSSHEEDYIRNHHRYQLASYQLALEQSLNQRVCQVSIAAYDPKKHTWELVPMNELPDINQELQGILPIRVEKGGLRRRNSYPKCKTHCEFSSICGK